MHLMTFITSISELHAANPDPISPFGQFYEISLWIGACGVILLTELVAPPPHILQVSLVLIRDGVISGMSRDAGTPL